MQISKYGIHLNSLTSYDLELVRGWRNSEHVRPYMEYRQIIDAKMQSLWFDGLDKRKNLYFIISKEGMKFGLIHLKELNISEGIAEAGIFVGETEFLNSISPILATICLMEFAFDVLKLKQLKAKIGLTNQRVIKFNESLGYKSTGEKSGNQFVYYSSNELQFVQSISRLKNLLEKLDNTMVLQCSMEEIATFALNKGSISECCKLDVI